MHNICISCNNIYSFNITMIIYNRDTHCGRNIANIDVRGERLRAIPLKSGMRQRCIHCPLSFGTVFKDLQISKKTREKKGRSKYVLLCR